MRSGPVPVGRKKRGGPASRSSLLGGLLAIALCLAMSLECRAREEGSREEQRPSVQTPIATSAPREVTLASAGTLQKVIAESEVLLTGPARGVRVVRDGQEAPVELGMELRPGDRIVTDDNTRVVITTKAGSEIRLDAGSDAALSESSLFLTLGTLLLEARELFRVETKFVVAGVEGTQLVLSVDRQDEVRLAVLEGNVRVESRTRTAVLPWSGRVYEGGEQGVIRGEAEPVKRPLDDVERRRLRQRLEDFEQPVRNGKGAGVAR